MTDARQTLGQAGEDVACAELQRRGYEILARRYRTRMGEIDIVARDGRTVVFVEVKTRTSAAWGLPAEAVTAHKRSQVRRMATDYLWRSGLLDEPCRFDVVSVTVDTAACKREIEVVADAFGADW
jgi:putative endonuclease